VDGEVQCLLERLSFASDDQGGRGKAKTLKEALHLAVHAVDSGEAEGRLERLIVVSNDG